MYKEFYIAILIFITIWFLIVCFGISIVKAQEIRMTATILENPCNKCLKLCK
jgi:hypothetical protein